MWSNIKKALAPRVAADAPVQPHIMYLNSGVGVAIIKWSDHMAADAALKHPIVRTALNKLAESVQQVPFKVMKDPNASDADQKGKEGFIKDLQAMLDNPNGEMTPAMMRYWLALNYAAYGRVAVKVGFGAINPERANGLYTLEARHVIAHLNSRGSAEKYDYGQGENKETLPSKLKAKIGKPFIEQIWKPGLKGYQHKDDQNSPLQSVGLPAQVITSLLTRAIQTAEGHPNVRYLVTCEKNLSKDQIKALKQHLNEDHGADGPDAGKVPILQNVGKIDIHTLDNDLSDIHSKTPSDDMARLIFGAFGIPPAVASITSADGAKFANNYVESRQSFWQDTLIPGYVNPIFQGLTRFLCPPGVKIAPDYDHIPALVAGRVLNMKETNEIKFLTTTEKRAIYGLEPNTALPETDVTPTTNPTKGKTDA